MSTNNSLVETVYAALKAEILSGIYVPGDRLDMTTIVNRFPSSKTPILNSIYRLVGERLLEAHPHDGFYIPRLSSPDLRDLYESDEDILNIILDRLIASNNNGQPLPPLEVVPDDPVAELEDIFLAIASLTGNHIHRMFVQELNVRLRAVRRLKQATPMAWSSDVLGFREAWSRNDLVGLKSLIHDYHARRLDMLPQLIAIAYTAPLEMRRDQRASKSSV